MRIVLDTGTLFRPEVLRELHAMTKPIVVPTVVVAERRRQLERDKRDVAAFLRSLDQSGFIAEPFTLGEAFAMPYVDDSRWRRHARDAMIAAHVREGDVLWTTNPRDFLALGLSPEQIRAV